MARKEPNLQTRKSLEDLAASWEQLCGEMAQMAESRAELMKKLHEYIQHAAECRQMARTALPNHRAQLQQMAATWERLAEGRKKQLEKEGKTADDDRA